MKRSQNSWAEHFWASAHRPFFLGAAVVAMLAMAWWLLQLAGLAPAGSLPPPVRHAHEMIFGYAVAVLSGFVALGTGGWRLRLLVALWIAGRLAIAADGILPPGLVAAIDLLYVPALALLRDPPLWRNPKWPTLGFVPALATLTAANFLVHAEALGWLADGARQGLLLAIDMFVMVMVVIAGRLVPGYTRAMRIAVRQPRDPPIERLSVALVLVLVAGDLAAADRVTGAAALALGLLQLLRLAGWRTRAVLDQPLLWILHLGFGWLGVGLVLRGAAAFLPALPPLTALHGITVGAIGTLTLGMMTRLARTHGRLPLRASGPTVLAYGCLSAAALLRVAAPLAAPAFALPAILAAGLLWIAAFAVYLGEYGRVLLRPRERGGD